jgi:hypothetical protein
MPTPTEQHLRRDVCLVADARAGQLGFAAADAFAAFKGRPRDAEAAALAGQYCRRRLRSL